MTDRAPEIARIIREEWDSTKETAEEFALRRFPDALLGDFKRAVKLLEELDLADNAAEDYWKNNPQRRPA